MDIWRQLRIWQSQKSSLSWSRENSKISQFVAWSISPALLEHLLHQVVVKIRGNEVYKTTNSVFVLSEKCHLEWFPGVSSVVVNQLAFVYLGWNDTTNSGIFPWLYCMGWLSPTRSRLRLQKGYWTQKGKAGTKNAIWEKGLKGFSHENLWGSSVDCH